MLDFYEKRRLRAILYSKASIALLTLVAVFLSMSAYERFRTEREMAAKRAEKELELSGYEQRAQLLMESVEHLENERGVEEEIRNRFDVVKDGEQVVVIVDDEGVPHASEGVAGSDEVSSGKTSLLEMLKFW